MPSTPDILPGQTITGAQFGEPMRVLSAERGSGGGWTLGLVGQRTSQYRQATLSAEDAAALSVSDAARSYAGDGRMIRVGLQACALGSAHEYDPYFALSASRVDPLPHQLEAVYDHLLKLPSARFLLADDAGAGKTIMAGLLIRELKMRGLVERILIVCPANLTFQWQRELYEKFDEHLEVLQGANIRNDFGGNEWLARKQVVTSLDLAKREDVLPGLRQARWDLVIVDEAHRMSAADESHKSMRYKLGELLRDSSSNILLLTATPHKGDPKNFALFLQLLDRDAYADVKSINRAMERRRAPFYLRRVKEAMVYFPERQPNGEWAARPVFTKRITRTADFEIEGDELELYDEVTKFVKEQSRRAATQGDDRRARAVGFLMSLYQRRLASSAYALSRSLGNRAARLDDALGKASAIAAAAPPDIDFEDLDELEDEARERLERQLDAIMLVADAESVRDEIARLRELAARAESVQASGGEAKLARLNSVLREQGFFDDPSRRLLIFTEFRDTLSYLRERLQEWGFRAGVIHGGMRPGGAREPGTRLYAERQFREGETQILVATEAAGEGINLQCCSVLFNYDIPWNPNRLEQRMGRIHRYGQTEDCLIVNFVANNTVEGRVLNRLLEKLQEIRDALDDDAVFNVVGEILPAAQIERALRDYYAGALGDVDFEERLLRDVDEGRFREICQTALEGLATRQLDLGMLVERKARAQELRAAPETIARFIRESAALASLSLTPVRRLPHAFDSGGVPAALKARDRDPDWRLPDLAARYGRVTTDKRVAAEHNLEWITAGHPLFEALRRHALDAAQDAWASGATFYSLAQATPARLDFYRARVADGMGDTLRERLFVLELADGAPPKLLQPDMLGDFALGDMTPAPAPDTLPSVASLPEDKDALFELALQPFLAETVAERIPEVERIAEHVDLSLEEAIFRADAEIGRAAEDVGNGVVGAEGRLVIAEQRHAELRARRKRRRDEHIHRRALTLQDVELLASALVLPHPDADAPDLRQMRPQAETERIAMEMVMAHEESRGCKVDDVHEQNLGYDVKSVHPESGELRLIEVKGLAAMTGTILLSPNERRVAEDRPDCYWLYIVTNCAATPVMQEPIHNPASLDWHEITKVQRYWLNVDAMTKPMSVSESQAGYSCV